MAGALGGLRAPEQSSPVGAFVRVPAGKYRYGVVHAPTHQALWLWP
ncbi:MAG: hypothetical protein JNK82_14205 [Myxococcaceae bacterium]|nr:hypothetical protein [Myxococcaceae bacterium]